MPENRGYTVGYDEETTSFFARRRAATHARFFLPHLRPRMKLLDCGSGVGSLTIDLAAAVAPAEAIGIDLETTQVAEATERARRSGVTNVRLPDLDGSRVGTFAADQTREKIILAPVSGWLNSHWVSSFRSAAMT